MSEDNNNEPIIEGHDYDGIQELDHPLPRWWVYLFYATIVYGVSYFLYYEFLGGPSHDEQYSAAMSKIEEKREDTTKAEMEIPVNVDLLLEDEVALKVGQGAFIQYCAACHGQNGEGVIGPNLTDEYWIHSKGEYKGIMNAIVAGFPEKGMPPWGDVVPRNQQPSLAAYVISLKGSKPQNPKAPQGELIK